MAEEKPPDLPFDPNIILKFRGEYSDATGPRASTPEPVLATDAEPRQPMIAGGPQAIGMAELCQGVSMAFVKEMASMKINEDMVIEPPIIRDNQRMGATVSREQERREPPPGDVEPPLGQPLSDEGGVPTGVEDTIREQFERAVERIRDELRDLDLTITVRNLPDGREIRIRRNESPSGISTSDEEPLTIRTEPSVRASATGARVVTADKNAVRAVRNEGDEEVTLVAAGQPTADGGSVSVVTQSRNSVVQVGFVNIVGVQVSLALGPIINIQINS